jgi:hypothetical protein
MMPEHAKAMVLRDAQGNYYVLPPEVVERARVPDERRAEIEAALGEVTAYGMNGAVGGGLVDLDGSYIVDEEVDPWPVIDSTRESGFVSAVRMLTGSRF